MEIGPIRAVSEWFIKPNLVVEESKKPYYLGSFELYQMSHFYIQTGLMFDQLPSKEGGMNSLLERLKDSLSSTLVHFYPLAGQLVTQVDEEQHNCFIYIDCNKGQGAKFIHAVLDNVTVNDIISPTYVPTLVQSFFDLGRLPINHDSHDEPMLVIQVTELADGIFLGVSVNHAIIDGSTFWHFVSSWSEIFKSNDSMISRKPILERWFPEGYGPIIKFPYTHPSEFITRYKANDENYPIQEVVFHFSSKSLASLKAKANMDCGLTDKISRIQALSGLVWRAMTRARRLQSDATITCFMLANSRSKLRPPLSQDYFGSFVCALETSIKVGELLENDLGYVALLLHQGVEDHNHEKVHNRFVSFIQSPFILEPGDLLENAILIGGTPRADVSNIDFGVGKVTAIRTCSNKYDGKVTLRPGIKEKGSINVEICLQNDTMTVIQEDEELRSFLF